MGEESASVGNGERRARTSISKVRTGCTTWIRRVKCDEAKPSCSRCLSTGRVCDGYSAPIRICKPQRDTVFHAHAGRSSNSRFTQVRDAPVPQSLTIDIQGTDSERHFFHIFRVAAEAGMASHINSVSCLWNQVAPHLSHHDEAIKHALVALGATHYLHMLVASKESDPVYASEYGIEKTKCFVLGQYNTSIKKLQEQIISGSPQSITVALVCCLAFICLENLRGNYRGGVAHLRNGTHIIESTLDLDYLCDSVSLQQRDPSKGCKRTNLPFISDTELKGLVNYFRQVEVCEYWFSHDVPLVLASQLYTHSRFDDGVATLPTEFSCLADAYKARVRLANDVLARDREMKMQRSDRTIFPSLRISLEQQCLFDRAALVSEKYQAFLASEQAPRPGTREYTSSCLDMLLIRSMQAIIAIMPLQSDEHEDLMNNPFFAHDIVGGMIHFAELLYEATKVTTNNLGSMQGFTLEAGIVAPMYFAYTHTTVSDYRTRALKILESGNLQEGPWDANLVAKLLGMRKSSSSGDLDLLRRWSASDLDCHTLFSQLKLRGDGGIKRSHGKSVRLKNGKHPECKKKACF